MHTLEYNGTACKNVEGEQMSWMGLGKQRTLGLGTEQKIMPFFFVVVELLKAYLSFYVVIPNKLLTRGEGQNYTT